MDARTDRGDEEPAVEPPGPVASPGPAQAALRRATADIHQAMHRHPAFAELMLRRPTMPAYARLLGRLYGFHHPLERALRARPAIGPLDPARREKAHLLRADLAAVGMPEARIDALPLCPFLPEIGSPGALVGCLYVLEGAGLGGKVIARSLDDLLGRGSPAGRRFFLGRPAPDPLPWPAYCRMLEACARQGHLAAIIDSAARTFKAVAAWLDAEDGGA